MTSNNRETPSSIQNLAPLFRFYAQSMHYPDKDWLTEEYFNTFCAILHSLEGKEEQSEIEKIAQDENNVEKLQVEHTRLFINAVPGVIAPPYGSVYRDKSLAGKYAEDIHLFYKEHGYTTILKDEIPESRFPDSLINQLYFLSYMAEDENEKIFHTFLQQFFIPWFHTFAAKVKEGAEIPFYPILISLIEFLTQEEDYAL